MIQPSRVFTNADVKPVDENLVPAPPVAANLPVTPAPGKSIYELRRERGEAELERTIRLLAQDADGLDTLKQRHRVACTGRTYITAMVNNRFIPVSIDNDRLPECMLLRSDIAALTTGIRRRLEQAEETARTSDVYPGTVRDMRRKYSLDGADLGR